MTAMNHIGDPKLYKLRSKSSGCGTDKQKSSSTSWLLIQVVLIAQPNIHATQSPTGSDNTFGGIFSTQSDAPKESLMLQCGSSQHSESNDLTPAKDTNHWFGGGFLSEICYKARVNYKG
ncbi:hypothetical protein Rs2_03574 [Raphanus sativus]|nr:hypothetical protein Rs2_03574 [Raphanus sativus]